MARNIYSFIKIEKRQTKRGIYASAFGIASLICMAVLTIASFVKAGNLLLVGQTPYSALQKRSKTTRKKAATVSVTALFHSGTGSET